MDITQASTEAIQYHRNQGYSEVTLDWYRKSFKTLSGYLQQYEISDTKEIDFQVVQDYLAWHHSRPRRDGKSGTVGQSTVNNHFKTLRCCFRYLEAMNEVEPNDNPTNGLKYIRISPPLIESYTPEQVRSLVAVMPDTFVGKRDKLLALLLLDTGLRISEALGQRVNTIDFSQNLLKVYKGKGSKNRQVPFGDIVKKELQAWIREHSLTETDHIFINSRTGKVITTAAFRNNLKGYGAKSGITNISVKPHTFRHTFALYFIRNGGGAFALQRILGHSTLEMTKRYVNMIVDDLQREHAACGPVDRLER